MNDAGMNAGAAADVAPLDMFAKYVLLLPVVAATFGCEFGDQLVIEYDFFGPVPTLPLIATVAVDVTLSGDQLVIE